MKITAVQTGSLKKGSAITDAFKGEVTSRD